ncbi:family 16 glycosylhydrolase [Umezawaea sp.]|uniref:family 16 glycosylhydrolase n=1 Tax=Umezawaea sp. TaxID=1955258 RepID=UPI002ED1ABCB
MLGAALLMTLGAISVSTPASSAPANSAQDVSAMATTFADEFNGPAGGGVDGSKWQLETGDNVNNHERQMYTNSRSNAATDGAGNLVITARKENPANYNCWYGRCEYTSARLNTAGRFTQTYGHYETRMKLPRGQGMWPAFWMLGADINTGNPWPGSGEIDIMENVGFEPNTVHGTLHGPGYSGSGGIGAAYNGPNFSDGFHTFAIDWAPNSIRWSVDGNVYQTRTPADLGGRQWVFNKPFFIIMNLAVGGYWPGDPNSSTQFPQQLLIDYVRVTTSDSPQPGGGQIIGLAGKCLDVAGANSANGTPIQIVGCNGNAAQNWSRPGDGTIRALGKCLDAASAGTANGTLVQLWDCNGTGAQQWAVSGARDIVNIPANKCLDVIGNNPGDGTRTHLWECTGAANQKWTV